MVSSFWNWLRAAPPQRPDLRMIVYTRSQCPLCDEAWELLSRLQKRWGFALESIDIDQDPELVSKYGNCVPVVAINGRVRFRGHVNEVLLRRILDAPATS